MNGYIMFLKQNMKQYNYKLRKFMSEFNLEDE